MARLLIADMDGTLVFSERLKARSYAEAARSLDPSLKADAVAEAYGHCVGWSRERIARTLLEEFGLEGPARRAAQAVGIPHEAPWITFVNRRLTVYRALLDGGPLVRRMARTEVVDAVLRAKASGWRVALATTSDRLHTGKVLRALSLEGTFEAVVTFDDVTATKPDPEAYQTVLARLDVPSGDAVALEDSPAGIRAARAAGVRCLALPTDYTADRIRTLVAEGTLPPGDVVEDPTTLPARLGLDRASAA